MSGARRPPDERRPPDKAGTSTDPGQKRPILERIGLALIALVLAALFGAMAAAAWLGGELFLAVMSAIGCGMTLWVGGLTLIRG